MTRRRSISKAERARIFAKTNGRCFHTDCQKRLAGTWIVEHLHPLALGGPDTEDNMMASCVDCAQRKTNGSKATSYGSDKHEIAKAKRLERGRLGECCSSAEKKQMRRRAHTNSQVVTTGATTAASAMCSRKGLTRACPVPDVPPGLQHSPKRPIPSRQFSMWRKFNGEIVSR